MATAPVFWTIDELGSQVALALAVGYDGAPNGRIRHVPDLRTIRYYTTLGLLDRPAAMRGRTALYHGRHLLQLVAIKRLQTQGLTLAAIQDKLLGQTDAALAEIAQLPAGSGPARPAEAARADFWKALPEPAPAVLPLESASPRPPVALQGVALTPAVTLLFAPERPLEPDDLEALRTVAGPLLKLLRARHLLGPRPEKDQR